MSKKKYKSKLIHNIDDDVYTEYAGHCKSERQFIGHALSKLMDKELKRLKKQTKRKK